MKPTIDQKPLEIRKREEEVPKHPVAARNRLTLGEDYDDEEDENTRKDEEEEMRRAMEEKKLRKAARRKEKSRERGEQQQSKSGKTLPTYEELIKTTLESEDKGFASDND